MFMTYAAVLTLSNLNESLTSSYIQYTSSAFTSAYTKDPSEKMAEKLINN